MKALLLFFVLSFTSTAALADNLEDVAVLGVSFGEGTFRLKLQDKTNPKNEYFFVRVTQDDAKSFEKLALVMKKLKQKEKFLLKLKIPSFSPYPSGSSYPSASVLFIGSAEGESVAGE
jgi:hypothetical protein